MNESEASMENKCPQCGAPLPSGVLSGLCPACLMKQGAAPDTAHSEGPQFQPPGIEEISRLFPQLEILSLIGKGGMGAVYRARQPALDRIVALKILPPQVATGSNFVERFNREARALAKLNHPNIVAVYEFGLAGGLSYFVMEYVDGVNLRELERAGKLSPREALQIVPQICEALQFAHDEGIVHRDIKPENILLDKKGRVKIADFGIAKILGGAEQVDLTGTQAAIGTPHYMAPEQMEKPTAVDHRADIFSLGVVFYEMLTGELPLGKFAPPSTRKVEVDVRLDDVVLRALEKDPELRYQHASQVKTAVDTISGSAAPPKIPEVDTQAWAQQILAQDYTLDINSCFRRAWSLLKTEFWPFVGITALILALFTFASSIGGAAINHRNDGSGTAIVSGTAGMFLWGPLIGGLCYYFLKKVRREKATVEAAFCGFTKERFLHLLLAGFATSLMTWVGFFCLVLPGIYLMVAWMFTLPLVVDKQLDFWSAMELSRKVVTKHWFKFLSMTLLMMLLMFVGALAIGFGIFVTMPIIFLMVMFAYEDIFGSVASAATPAATGPSGTIVITPPKIAASNPGTGKWSTATKMGMAGVGLLILIIMLTPLLRHIGEKIKQRNTAIADTAVPSAPAYSPDATGTAVEAEPLPADAFGPGTETDLTNLSAINVATAEVQPLPPTVAEMNRGPEKDSAVCNWLESTNMDFAFVSAYDGFYSMTRDMTPLKRDDWETATPQSIGGSLRDTGHDLAVRFGDSSMLNNPTNFTYGFKTRAGLIVLLQITGYTENPSGVKMRYKFFQPATNQDLTTASAINDAVGLFSSRFEAAQGISDMTARDRALAAVATDAAKSGYGKIAQQAAEQISDITAHDSAIHQAVLLLSKRGLRKQAVDLAKEINDMTQRDQTLSELAQ